MNINKLSIRILTPNGYKLQSIQDVFSITHITEKADSLDIWINENFGPNSFNEGNRIGFNELYDEESDLNPEISKYLQNNEFEITNINTSDKKITIAKTTSGYDSDGNEVYPEIGTLDFKSQSNGKIMNLSIQSTFGFNIKSAKFSFPEKQQIT